MNNRDKKEVTSCKHDCPHRYRSNTDPPKQICTIDNREIHTDDLEDIGMFGKIYTRQFPRWCPLNKEEGVLDV